MPRTHAYIATEAAPAHPATATMAPVPLPAEVPDPLEDPVAANSWRNHLAREERSLEHTLKKQLFHKLMMVSRDSLTFSPFTQYKSVVDAAQAFGALGDFYREHHPEEAEGKLAQAYNWCRIIARAPTIDEFLKMASEAAQEKVRQTAVDVACQVSGDDDLQLAEYKYITYLKVEIKRVWEEALLFSSQLEEVKAENITLTLKIEHLEHELERTRRTSHGKGK